MPAADQRPRARRHVVIVGAMGSGKTTLGHGLAKRLGRALHDSDEWIVARTGRNSRQIALAEGVEALHRLEREALFEAMATPQPSIITAAASVIEDPKVRGDLEDTFCVWVTACPEILAARTAGESHRRRLAEDEAEKLTRRDAYFEACADLIIDTGTKSEMETLSEVLSRLDPDLA